MKTLLILRHAKSSWAEADVPDHDRPLNKRGKHDAPRVGRLLADAGLQPQQIISSTAKRARQTAARVADACGCQDVVVLSRTLYLASAEVYLDVLRGVPDSLDRVMVVGHNPGLEQLLQLLTGQQIRFPTAALAHVQLDVAHWRDLLASSPSTLAALWVPRDLD
ncbi:MAG: histidine phosphatase family protein [Planctomycetes bacterium]|nr:histidine phosphatase family protein [Planctomycetota bacterium]